MKRIRNTGFRFDEHPWSSTWRSRGRWRWGTTSRGWWSSWGGWRRWWCLTCQHFLNGLLELLNLSKQTESIERICTVFVLVFFFYFFKSWKSPKIEACNPRKRLQRCLQCFLERGGGKREQQLVVILLEPGAEQHLKPGVCKVPCNLIFFPVPIFQMLILIDFIFLPKHIF